MAHLDFQCCCFMIHRHAIIVYFIYMLGLFDIQFSMFQCLSAYLPLCCFQISIHFLFQLFSCCCYIYISAISLTDRLFLIRLEQISRFAFSAQQFLQLSVLHCRFCIICFIFWQLGSQTVVLASLYTCSVDMDSDMYIFCGALFTPPDLVSRLYWQMDGLLHTCIYMWMYTFDRFGFNPISAVMLPKFLF